MNAFAASKLSPLKHVLGEELKRKMSTHGNWMPMLPGRELGNKQKRKKSTLGTWLSMLPEREPDEKQKRKSTLTDWLPVMSIKKAQTFEKMGIHLEETVFTHGQLYIAFLGLHHFVTIGASNSNIM